MSSSELYLTFLSQIGSKTLLNQAKRINPDLWDATSEPKFISPKLSQFQVSFWKEVSRNWESGNKVKLSKICEESGRTPKYWTCFFSKTPEALVWVLAPLKDLMAFNPLVRGIMIKSQNLLRSDIAKTGGSIRTREARIIIRLLELVYARG